MVPLNTFIIMSKQSRYLILTVFLCFKAGAQDTNFKTYTQKIGGSPQVYDMVAIPGGEFSMGSPANEKGRRADEGPQHKVKIEPFWMGKTEVTWDIYDLYAFKNMEKEMGARHPDPDKSVQKTDASTRPSPPYVDMSFGMGRSGYPAINMTQYAAIYFCKWLYEKTGIFYRLPTEAEWEFAAREGGEADGYNYSGSNVIGKVAWYEANSEQTTHPVAGKAPNKMGIYDMSGNVWEWCSDWYGDYSSDAETDPSGPSSGSGRISRGGAWDFDGPYCQNTFRDKVPPSDSNRSLGFRLAADL